MKITKTQLREMVKASLKKQLAESQSKTMKITIAELNTRVRAIVQTKLAEAHRVPSLGTIAEGLGYGSQPQVATEKPAPYVLTDKDQLALKYASQLAKTEGKSLNENVQALKTVKRVVNLTDDELEVVSPILKEWAKYDESISDTALALAENLTKSAI